MSTAEPALHGRALQAEREQQQKLRDQQKLRNKLTVQADSDNLFWLVSSKEGRRFLWRMWDRAAVFGPEFNPNTRQSDFNDGKRAEACDLMRDVVALFPKQFQLLMQERADELERNRINADDTRRTQQRDAGT